MKPYYSHAGIQIFHGDCREILPQLDIEVIVTDPPYGISYRPEMWKRMDGSVSQFEAIRGDDSQFDPSHLLTYKTVVIWGANYFSSLLPVGGWICWDKRCTFGGESGAGRRGCEMQWALELRDACKERGISLFIKQMGGRTPAEGKASIPAELMIQEFPEQEL